MMTLSVYTRFLGQGHPFGFKWMACACQRSPADDLVGRSDARQLSRQPRQLRTAMLSRVGIATFS